jgi:hypothetical protein
MPQQTYNLENILFKSGDLFLPKQVRDFLEYYYVGNDRSILYITNWTIIHFLSGVLTAYFLRERTRYSDTRIYLIAFLIHTLWELWQIFGENTPIGTLRGQIDVLVDTAAYMLGAWAYIQFKK